MRRPSGKRASRPLPASGARADRDVRAAVALAMDDVFAVLDGAGWRSSTAAEVINGMVAERPWAAMAIVGHGAEHCLALAGGWIATSSDYGLAGPLFAPAAVRPPILLLFACGALRAPGHSCPPSRHLAAALASAGTVVVGPARNLRPDPAAACLFAEAVARGDDVASICRSLAARNPAGRFVLWGDGETRASPFRAGSAIFSSSNRSGAPRQLGAALERSARVARLLADATAWRTRAGERRTASVLLERVRTAALAGYAAGKSDLGLADALDAASGAATRALLADLETEIAAGRWLETAFGAVTRPSRPRALVCPTCGGDAQRVDHRAPGRRSISSTECDRCGSVEDRIGAGGTAADLVAAHDDLACTVAPLPPGGEGRIVVHRVGAGATWPRGGGAVRLRLPSSAPRGRITVAALRAAPQGLHVAYRHLWRDSR